MNKRTIIITGGAGYIGAHLATALSDKYNVITIDKKSLKKRIPYTIHIQQDLLSPLGLEKVFRKADFCIHLAAEVGGVAFANTYPAVILSNNSRIDLNVTNLCYKSKVKRYVYISSSLVYEKCETFPLKEEYAEKMTPPLLSYGFEKLYGERLCDAYNRQYGLPFSVCRLFNIYGKNILGNSDPNGHVIPDLIRKVKSSKGTVDLLGKKGIRRNFSHVDDVVKGIIAVLENKKGENEIFNIASNYEYTLEQVTELLWKLLKKNGKVTFKYLPSYKQDVKRNYASVTKAKKLLGWSPNVSIEEGLSRML